VSLLRRFYRELMRIFPTHCSSCGRLGLSAETVAAEDGGSPCECGATARVLPGATYGVADVRLFDAIVAALQDADITWMNATRLLIALERCESRRPQARLQLLKRLAPSLSAIERMTASQPALARSAVGMLEVLLEALTQSRSQSGVMPGAIVARMRAGLKQ